MLPLVSPDPGFLQLRKVEIMTSLEPRAQSLDPMIHPELYDTIRIRRSIAFLIDAAVITVLMLVASVIVFVLGLITLGLGWFLYVILWPAVAILYYLASFAGGAARTTGMGFTGIELRMRDGERPDALIGLAHPLLFFLSVSFLTPIILLVSLLSARRCLAHDIVLGTVMVDAEALRRLTALPR